MKASDRGELRRRLEAAGRNAAGRRQLDDDVRVEVVDYVRARVSEGASKTQATRELGLEQRTVWGWLQRHARRRVREVEVADSPTLETTTVRTFELRLASNAVIDGPTLEDISALLRSSR